MQKLDLKIIQCESIMKGREDSSMMASSTMLVYSLLRMTINGTTMDAYGMIDMRRIGIG